MFNIEVNLEQNSLQLADFIRELEQRAARTLREAAREYIFTSISIIPVYGGASHATFVALADAIDVPLQINPVARSTISQGLQSSSGEFNNDAPSFSFVYETDLPHLNVNEREDATRFGFRLITPGPYNFRAIAGAAAQSVLDSFTPPDFTARFTRRTLTSSWQIPLNF